MLTLPITLPSAARIYIYILPLIYAVKQAKSNSLYIQDRAALNILDVCTASRGPVCVVIYFIFYFLILFSLPSLLTAVHTTVFAQSRDITPRLRQSVNTQSGQMLSLIFFDYFRCDSFQEKKSYYFDYDQIFTDVLSVPGMSNGSICYLGGRPYQPSLLV
jgi:hypothetical protein